MTSAGRNIIVGRMQGSTPSQAEPKFVGWGTNPSGLTSAVTDIAPFFEAQAAGRTSGTSSTTTTTTTDDTYTVTGTIVAGGTLAIAECFLADASTQPTQGTVAAGGVVGSNSATTLNTSASFTTGNSNYIQIRTEVMEVTAGSGTTALTVVRAQNGSAAISTIAATDNVSQGNIPGGLGHTVSGGNTYLHADFAVINLSSGDSIAFTINTKFS